METSKLLNYLRMYRKRSGLTQRELAFLLGLADGSKISYYEQGKRTPTLPTVFALEIVLGVRDTELFKGMHEEIRKQVILRTQTLYRGLAKRPATPALQQKVDALRRVTNAGNN